MRATIRVGDVNESHLESLLGLEETRSSDVGCGGCGATARVKERPLVTYVDLPVFGAPMRLTWKKHRMRCPNPVCGVETWVERDHRIAARRAC